MGSFSTVAPRIASLRKLNLRLYLPTHSTENLTALRILTSLGIECAAVITRETDWEALADLATHALLGLVKHASLQPFEYVAAHYDPQQRTDFGAVYFDDPRAFLHLDRQGSVQVNNGEDCQEEVGQWVLQTGAGEVHKGFAHAEDEQADQGAPVAFRSSQDEAQGGE